MVVFQFIEAANQKQFHFLENIPAPTYIPTNQFFMEWWGKGFLPFNQGELISYNFQVSNFSIFLGVAIQWMLVRKYQQQAWGSHLPLPHLGSHLPLPQVPLGAQPTLG